jgi:hypothetical protein
MIGSKIWLIHHTLLLDDMLITGAATLLCLHEANLKIFTQYRIKLESAKPEYCPARYRSREIT